METIKYETWKYKIEILEPTSDEFKFVQHFFNTSSTEIFMDHEISKNFQIYKVIKQNNKETVDEKSNNLMLFHGTSQESAAGILKNGFKNSEEGFFGKGVYMIESSEIAYFYPV